MESGFLWGASTSAHQVEGNTIHSDWWEWERSHKDFPKSGRASGHYELFAQDFALAKSFGRGAHRLSTEWSRIEPEEGVWNYKEVAHYRAVLEELRRLGIRSFVTLHHFTNPAWFAKRGAFARRDNVELFVRYVAFISQQLGDLVDFWVTINEPMVYAQQSYLYGVWPPRYRNIFTMWRVIDNLVLAHIGAYKVIHRYLPNARVGIAKHVVAYLPAHHNNVLDRVIAGVENWWFNHRFLRLTGNTHDFMGVNYYFTRKAHFGMAKNRHEKKVSDMGWPINPSGLTRALLEMNKYGLPLYVTENGLADQDDSLRADFIRDHLRAVEKAQADGAQVRGYLHWSLIDNFEWADGFTPRFGLVEVDYATMKRMPRPSAYVYKAIIEQAKG